MTDRRSRWIAAAAAALALLFAGGALAAPAAVEPAQLIDSALKQDYSPAIRNLIALSMLSLIPVMLVAMTSFTRIVIVLSVLRHALGLPQTPPNAVIVTLAICLTYFSMAPGADRVNDVALKPYLAQQIGSGEALAKGLVPMREFMVGQTRESDLRAVVEMANQPPPQRIEDIRLRHLLPAFLLSELKTAFQIAFVIFLPFLLIDLVVGAVLMALGMIMVPPATISLPLKILLFVLIDGWVLVSRALLGSYWS